MNEDWLKKLEQELNCTLDTIIIGNTQICIIINPDLSKRIITNVDKELSILDYLFEVSLSLSINILPEYTREFYWYISQRDMYLLLANIESKINIFSPNTCQIENNHIVEQNFIGPQGIQYKFKVLKNI